MSTSRTMVLFMYIFWAVISLEANYVNGQQTASKTFKQYCVDTHNSYRSKHKVPNIKWSDTLEKEAKSWAQYLSESNNLFRGSKGENLYLSTKVQPYTASSCETAVNEFYTGESKYSYDRALLSRASERFTQLVWKNTLEIGAAGLQRKDNKTVVVVRYNPPGNYNTTVAFKSNVFPASSKQTSSSQSDASHVQIQIPLTLVAVLAAMHILA
ncbi:Golgi-associated plant pathogenesis-related protein 1-like [Actinia tenebrosa]|uniref:Golgi-associated plant pathogenesis-related protein 1-like n=1 Tax=Actinia tenebrosa TaxID=6105 RepID=A0A6P8GYK6_ACTTE|nr:Golgi-associated plant pathogenesis-related protein 1-like [Actinia tenebrosa]